MYFNVIGGGNKKGNVYGLGALSKRFTSSTSVDSTTSKPLVVNQIEEMRETIQKLNVELMEKHAKEQTLEENMEQMLKDHEQMMKDQEHIKLSLQYIQVNNLISDPSNPTPNGRRHREDHIRDDSADQD